MKDTKEFVYGLNARPAMIGTVPSGFISIDEADSRARHGVIKYTNELPPEKIEQYELINLNLNSKWLSIKDGYNLLSQIRRFSTNYDLATLEALAADQFGLEQETLRLSKDQWLRVVDYGSQLLAAVNRRTVA